MKKAIATVIIIFISLSSHAQSDTAIVYHEIVKADSTTTDELFARARIWFARYYSNAADSFQLTVNENDELVGKSFILYRTKSFFKRSETASGKIRYTVSVKVKDDMYQYEISGFEHTGSYSAIDPPANFGLFTSSPQSPADLDKSWNMDDWYDKIWKELKDVAANEAKAIAASLKEAMKIPAKNK